MATHRSLSRRATISEAKARTSLKTTTAGAGFQPSVVIRPPTECGPTVPADPQKVFRSINPRTYHEIFCHLPTRSAIQKSPFSSRIPSQHAPCSVTGIVCPHPSLTTHDTLRKGNSLVYLITMDKAIHAGTHQPVPSGAPCEAGATQHHAASLLCFLWGGLGRTTWLTNYISIGSRNDGFRRRSRIYF